MSRQASGRLALLSGVFYILLSEAVSTGSLTVLGRASIFIAVKMVYMPMVEEPGMVKRFGDEYVEYKRNVPRVRG